MIRRLEAEDELGEDKEPVTGQSNGRAFKRRGEKNKPRVGAEIRGQPSGSAAGAWAHRSSSPTLSQSPSSLAFSHV